MTTEHSLRMNSLAVIQAVDALCDRYEEALRCGAAGALAAWLPTGPARAAALVELVRLEFEYRLLGGETARPDEYFVRFPELVADAALAARLRSIERRLSSRRTPV